MGLSTKPLPTTIPNGMTNDSIIKLTQLDKKARAGKVQYVLPLSIGEMNDFGGAFATYVDPKIVMGALNQTRS